MLKGEQLVQGKPQAGSTESQESVSPVVPHHEAMLMSGGATPGWHPNLDSVPTLLRFDQRLPQRTKNLVTVNPLDPRNPSFPILKDQLKGGMHPSPSQ